MVENFKDVFDFDDIVFENRNKEYGAFQLRKKYKRTVIIGFVISSLFMTLIVIVPFVLSLDLGEEELSGNMLYYSVRMESLDSPIDILITPPPPLPPPPPKGSIVVQEAVKYVPPVVVDTVFSAEENNFAAVDEILLQTTIEHSGFNGTGTGDEMSYGFGDGNNDGTFFFVEIMPSFRGGDINAFREWIQRRIIYPQAAIDAKIKGTVYITFIIEADGSVSNVTVIQGVAAIIDDEVVKAIQSSPKWNPGYQRGQPVRIRHSMPLTFIL